MPKNRLLRRLLHHILIGVVNAALTFPAENFLF
jgi:hypothetical protein